MFLVVTTVHRSSQARDQTCATAVTQAMALTAPDPQPAEPPRNTDRHLHMLSHG